jgi:hypothetical protein
MIDDVVLRSAIEKKRDVGVVAIGENPDTKALESSGEEVGGPEDPCLLGCPSIVGIPIETVYEDDAGAVGISLV